MSSETSAPEDRDEHYEFGMYVASKLRKMDKTQSIYAEHLINQVLFGGMIKKLREDSTISTP